MFLYFLFNFFFLFQEHTERDLLREDARHRERTPLRPALGRREAAGRAPEGSHVRTRKEECRQVGRLRHKTNRQEEENNTILLLIYSIWRGENVLLLNLYY